MKQTTIDANTDKPCSCCGRTHRKLYLLDGYWLGQNCREDYKFYRGINQKLNDINMFFSARKVKQLRAMTSS